MDRYLIIIEQSATGFSAYSPDVPGCVATGGSRAVVKREMHNAIEFPLEGLREERCRFRRPPRALNLSRSHPPGELAYPYDENWQTHVEHSEPPPATP